MILAGDCRKGARLLYKNEPFYVVDFQHVKPGKGGAFVRLKMRNLLTNLLLEVTLRPEEKFEKPDLAYRTMQFLYEQDGMYVFMDADSYDQVELNRDSLEEVLHYLQEGVAYTMLYWGEKPVTVTPPIHMEMVVAETVPGVRGDTAQGAASKPATTNTGLVVQVPLFVNEGDKIKVDTREGVYVERVQ